MINRGVVGCQIELAKGGGEAGNLPVKQKARPHFGNIFRDAMTIASVTYLDELTRPALSGCRLRLWLGRTHPWPAPTD